MEKDCSSHKRFPIVLEPNYIFGCIRDGAKFTKRGKGSIQPMVCATLQILDSRILVNRYLPQNLLELANQVDKPVYLDIRTVKNPSTKGRNVRYRVAASPGWTMVFNITWDKTIVSRNEMLAAITDAGKFTGLGDGRTLGFGRFIIEEVNIKEEEETA